MTADLIPAATFLALVACTAGSRHLRTVHAAQGRHVAVPGRDAASFPALHAKHYAATETVLSDLLAELRRARAAGVRLVPGEVAA